MVRRPPTDRQLSLLRAMLAHRRQTRTWPSHRQLAVVLGLRSNNLKIYLDMLIAKGLAERLPGVRNGNVGLTGRSLDLLEGSDAKAT